MIWSALSRTSPNVSFSKMVPLGIFRSLKSSNQWSGDNASPRTYFRRGTMFWRKGEHIEVFSLQSELSYFNTLEYLIIEYLNVFELIVLQCNILTLPRRIIDLENLRHALQPNTFNNDPVRVSHATCILPTFHQFPVMFSFAITSLFTPWKGFVPLTSYKAFAPFRSKTEWFSLATTSGM